MDAISLVCNSMLSCIFFIAELILVPQALRHMNLASYFPCHNWCYILLVCYGLFLPSPFFLLSYYIIWFNIKSDYSVYLLPVLCLLFLLPGSPLRRIIHSLEVTSQTVEKPAQHLIKKFIKYRTHTLSLEVKLIFITGC